MRKPILFSTIVLLPAIAHGQPIAGLYVSGSAGVNFTEAMTAFDDSRTISSRLGPLGDLSVGWGLGNGFRVEIDGSVRSNNVANISTRRLSGQFLPVDNVSGSVTNFATMVNAIYEVNLSRYGVRITPYIGVGLGYAWLDMNSIKGSESYSFSGLPGNNTYNGPADISYGTGGTFAYQAMVGAALPLRLVPGLQATIEYRFFGTAHADIIQTATASNGNTVNGVSPTQRGHYGFQALDHAVLIGLRYPFGVPWRQ